jgi:hypothetical protein
MGGTDHNEHESGATRKKRPLIKRIKRWLRRRKRAA